MTATPIAVYSYTAITSTNLKTKHMYNSTPAIHPIIRALHSALLFCFWLVVLANTYIRVAELSPGSTEVLWIFIGAFILAAIDFVVAYRKHTALQASGVSPRLLFGMTARTASLFYTIAIGMYISIILTEAQFQLTAHSAWQVWQAVGISAVIAMLVALLLYQRFIRNVAESVEEQQPAPHAE